MSSNPYFTSNYNPSQSKVIDRSTRLVGTQHANLLQTEPKDLDKLFHRNSFQQKAEEDICFPSNKRPSVSSNTSTLNGHQRPSRQPADAISSIIQTAKEVNLNALQDLFDESKSAYDGSRVAMSYQDSKFPYKKDLDDYISNQRIENKLLSLYGDNNLTHNHGQQQQQNRYSEHSYLQRIESKNRFMYYHPDTGSLVGETLQGINLPPDTTLEELLLRDNYWLDVTLPNENEMAAISKMFHIHPLTTEDIMSFEIREKCDVFRDYMFVCYRAFIHDYQQLRPVTFYNIITKKHILTFHFDHVPHVHHVKQRIRQLQDYIEIVPDWINYAIMDEITDSFAPIIQQIESEVDSIDDSVMLYKANQTDVVLRIGTCRKKVIQMVRLLGTKVEVIRGLTKRILEEHQADQDMLDTLLTEEKIYPDVGLYLGDVQDHILTMLQNLSHYETVLARSESNYLARISIELTQTSNSTNHVIGRLTIFATIMLPMNLITGLWGMNVKVPGKDYDNLTYFFWIISSLVIFAILSLTLAKRIKLI
ncbi:putative metal ion transporter C17A12.14 [Choanephora cucurbitarum]|uniref:Putative metal ion transporter C17A12.14 n=1 Tax=Choanephora cucurbitarum TaxID=101091 RepID=A0A1C7NDU2_9FUNG|nr:putative metal ion transporter C17A12.14 [Choanephora cucurbitarum]